MAKLPEAVLDVIEALSDLPGIGARSAERLTFTLLRNHNGLDMKIAKTLSQMRENVAECAICCHLCDKKEEKSICGVCLNGKRNPQQICVVESPSDILAMERTDMYSGSYHVLHGLISPMARVSPADVRLKELLVRFGTESDVREVIFALPSSTEGESTSLYITEQLKDIFGGTITRLARGIPSGGVLDYLDAGTLGRAMMERRNF
jgi:recombination protein RecR